MTPALPPTGAHLWFRLTASADAGVIAAAVHLLSEEERARHARFVFDRDRRDFAIAHALVRRTLSRYRDAPPESWTFSTNAFGKPAIAARGDAPLCFNLAHTHGLVACAVTEATGVGVDVESLDRSVSDMEIADRYFAPSEIEALRACGERERAGRFIELWTLKEAYIKAIGSGLSHPLDRFAVTFDGAAGLRFDAPGEDPDAWTFALFAPSPSHRMAVAFRSGRAGAPPIATFDEETGRETRQLLRSTRREGRATERR